MIRFPALFVLMLGTLALLTGCSEQDIDAPLDTPLSEELEADPAPSPPAVEPVEAVVDAAYQDSGGSPPKSKLGSIFNALKVGTAEALDETAQE